MQAGLPCSRGGPSEGAVEQRDQVFSLCLEEIEGGEVAKVKWSGGKSLGYKAVYDCF